LGQTLHDFRLVKETRDSAWANAVINHPEVKPGLALGYLDGDLDISPLVESPDNVLYMGEFGGALFHWCAPGVYDVHNFILPEGRGAWGKRACLEIIEAIFERGARMIWCMTPVENRACRLLNRMLGFASEGVSRRHLAPCLPAQELETFVLCR
jgi:hypothetical protein